MNRFPSTTRAIAMLATAGLIATTAIAPALARGPVKIVLPAKTAANPDSRLCMPKTTLGKNASREMADTVCQTRSEWEAAGVTFVVK